VYATLSARIFLQPSSGVHCIQLDSVAAVLRNGFCVSTLISRPASAASPGCSVLCVWTRGFCCTSPEASAWRGHICDTLTRAPVALLSLSESDFRAGYRGNSLVSSEASVWCGNSCVTLLSASCALKPVFCAWNRGNHQLSTFADLLGWRHSTPRLSVASVCASPEPHPFGPIRPLSALWSFACTKIVLPPQPGVARPGI
jgi:hypothetical protein